MPIGVVRKNIAMSVSATTRWDVWARSQNRTNVVAGMSNAKAIALYARSVIARTFQDRRKSPSELRNRSRTVCHIAQSPPRRRLTMRWLDGRAIGPRGDEDCEGCYWGVYAPELSPGVTHVRYTCRVGVRSVLETRVSAIFQVSAPSPSIRPGYDSVIWKASSCCPKR